MSEYLTAGMGGLWIQPDGPGTELVFLGCHQVEGVDSPQGDETPFYCPNPALPKDFIAVGSSSSPPEMITFSIMERLTSALSHLREQICPFPLYITMTSCGRKDVFDNADTIFAYNVRKITSRSLSNLVMLDSDDPVTRNFDVSALPPDIEMRAAVAVLVSSTSVEDLNDIVFCDDSQCADSCGSAIALGQNGFIATSEA